MALNYRLRPCVIKLRGNGLHPAGERERGVKAAAGGGAVSSVNYLRFQTRAKRVYTSNSNGNKPTVPCCTCVGEENRDIEGGGPWLLLSSTLFQFRLVPNDGA